MIVRCTFIKQKKNKNKSYTGLFKRWSICRTYFTFESDDDLTEHPRTPTVDLMRSYLHENVLWPLGSVV